VKFEKSCPLSKKGNVKVVLAGGRIEPSNSEIDSEIGN